MWRRWSTKAAVVVGGLLVLWGCGKAPPTYVARPPEPWRVEEEGQCLTGGHIRRNPWLAERSAVGGPGCGIDRPFEMAAALNGQVSLKPPAVLRCPMIPAIEKWVLEVVNPAARRHFGLPVVELKVVSSFACRPLNHVRGARLSEHGYGNALDVAAFQLGDGRWVNVKSGWYGDPRERAFLRHAHQGACDIFTTVLGPNYDANHRDHFHVDLAWHGRDGRVRICK